MLMSDYEPFYGKIGTESGDNCNKILQKVGQNLNKSPKFLHITNKQVTELIQTIWNILLLYAHRISGDDTKSAIRSFVGMAGCLP